LVPVVDHTVFSMLPQLPEEEEQETKHSSSNTADFNAKRTMLAESYGSVKRQRMLRMSISNQYDIKNDAESQAVLDLAIADATKAGTETFVLEFDSLPAFDAQTTDVTKIYDLNTLVSAEVWDAVDTSKLLKTLSEMQKADVSIKAGGKGSLLGLYVTRVLNSLQGVADAAARKRLAGYLQFLDYLIRFVNLPRHRKAQGLEFFGYIPETIKVYLLGTFAERVAKGDAVKEDNVTDALNNKLLCFICVVALTVRRFVLDEEDLKCLSTDLKMDAKQLSRYFVQVGCQHASSKKASLKAPLRLPELKSKGQTRK